MELNERAWAKGLAEDLSDNLSHIDTKDFAITVFDGKKLPYKYEVNGYSVDGTAQPEFSSYETDLLISDKAKDGSWVPRVIIECKLAITTHDALTYSAKAATHKHVHPYLRYGILVGRQKKQALPGRLVKHGAYFDFMLSWEAQVPNKDEWKLLTDVLGEEIESSRILQEMLKSSRDPRRKRYQSLHRKLVLK